jgi:hypothetical protein
MKLRVSKVSALIASAAAASQAENAAAQPFPFPPVAGATTYTFEGGIPFSNFSNSSVPGGALSYLDTADKIGNSIRTTGNPNPGTKFGGYGSFSVTRNIDAVNDWRFSTGFNLLSTGTQNSTASGDYISGVDILTAQSSLAERDRFGLFTFDFDFGRNWSAGIFQVRSFAGLRAVYERDRFDTTADKTGFSNYTETVTGRSSFFGLGPRAGIEFSTGNPIGIVGSFSGALMGGTRQSSVYDAVVNFGGGLPAFASDPVKSNENSWIGNLSGSLGVAWQFSPTGQLVVGYKVDQWYNVRESFNFAFIDKKQDILIQTPFIRAAFRF